jgi:D-tyrosyl-tRNA(Tyr) deacylase
MKVVLQRVSSASVCIDKKTVASIEAGMLILLGIAEEDSLEDIAWLCKKITTLRIFNDQNGVMNNSLLDVNGEVIVVSQFTLFASTKKGNRPSYSAAAKPEIAIPFYQEFVLAFEKEMGRKVQTGQFGADMSIALMNDGPVTIVIDSKNKI